MSVPNGGPRGRRDPRHERSTDTTQGRPSPHEHRLKNVTSNWASLGTGILVSFFLAPFVVHSLGNVYYGIWALISDFTGYLWLLDFGVRESVIKFVAQYHASDRRDELVATVNGALFCTAASRSPLSASWG